MKLKLKSAGVSALVTVVTFPISELGPGISAVDDWEDRAVEGDRRFDQQTALDELAAAIQ